MKVKELMFPSAVCVRSESPLIEATALMRQLGTNSLPVCDHGRLTGLLTEADLTKTALEESRPAEQCAVRAAMSPGVVFVFEEDDVPNAARLMEQCGIDHIPVLNRDHRLTGLLALRDVEGTAPETENTAARASGPLIFFDPPERNGPRCSDR